MPKITTYALYLHKPEFLDLDESHARDGANGSFQKSDSLLFARMGCIQEAVERAGSWECFQEPVNKFSDGELGGGEIQHDGEAF